MVSLGELLVMKDFFFTKCLSYFDLVCIIICGTLVQRVAEAVGIWGILG